MSTNKNATFGFSVEPKRRVGAWNEHNTIGVVSPGYGMEKVSYGLSPANFSFNKLFRAIPHRLINRGTFLKNTPVLLDYPVEMVHTFNELPIGIRPFVVTFENELPRYFGKIKPWQFEVGFDLLASSRCRKILALSNAAAEPLRQSLIELGLTDIISKVSVFRGGVFNSLSTPKIYSHEGSSLRVLFVGRDAFGKGLLPMLDALEDCWTLGANIKATVVCNFESRGLDKNQIVKSEQLIEHMTRNENITFHRRLSNFEIQEQMRVHDVFIFPTLDESLGWVAVEAGMAGMPIISTDVFAIPELVLHGKTGWLIPMHKNHKSRWVGLWLTGKEYEQEVLSTFTSIRNYLVQHLTYFLDKPEMVNIMGSASRAHISSLYNAATARQKLAEIYSEALA